MWYAVSRLQQNKQKIPEVLVAALLFFLFLIRLMFLMLQLQLNQCHPGRVNRRKTKTKTKVLQTWRITHSYLSGTYYVCLLFCCCCCWTKWEIFQFKMLLWISVSTIKLVKSKHWREIWDSADEHCRSVHLRTGTSDHRKEGKPSETHDQIQQL